MLCLKFNLIMINKLMLTALILIITRSLFYSYHTYANTLTDPVLTQRG